MKKMTMNVFKVSRHLKIKNTKKTGKIFKVIKQYGQLRKKKRIMSTKKLDPQDPTETDLKIDTARSKEPELRTPIKFSSNR